MTTKGQHADAETTPADRAAEQLASIVEAAAAYAVDVFERAVKDPPKAPTVPESAIRLAIEALDAARKAVATLAGRTSSESA